MRVRGQLDLAGVAESDMGPSRVRFHGRWYSFGAVCGNSRLGFDINICRNSAAVSYTRLTCVILLLEVFLNSHGG